MPSLRPSLALAIFLLAACAPRPAARPTATAPTTWESASWEDRHATMTWTVLPNMGRLFQHERRTASPELTCRTCHGPDAEAVHYAMPHGLVALDPAHLPSASSSDPEEARTAVFMADVTERMRTMIDAAPWDPTTGRGFSCFSCHPKAGR